MSEITDELKAATLKWLDEQHCILWSGSFVLKGSADVHKLDEERERAIEWLVSQMEAVLERAEVTVARWKTCAVCGNATPDAQERKDGKVRCDACQRLNKPKRK